VTAYATTFYSFKGGVGRTTLLVNVANVLADRGERVLIWDLDLEAPGVHHFPGLQPPEQVWQSGFLEWLGDTPRCPTADPTPAWPSEPWLNMLGERVYAARGEHRGTIFVLPALGSLTDLGQRYAAVDWNTLFVEYPEHGLHLLCRARDALIARFEPTFLFIDSRTGVSDLGGFVTRYLPDCTVLVGNYSAQSTEGLRSVYLALDRFATERGESEPYRRSKLDRMLVASPVPVSLPARERGRERWSSGFPGVAPRTLIEIPLVENLLYAEDVLIRSAPSSDAARAYQLVAERLIELRTTRVRSEQGARTHAETDEPSRLANVERLLQLLGFETAPYPHADADFAARERTPLAERTYWVTYISAQANSTVSDFLDRIHDLPASARAKKLLIVEMAHDDERGAAQAAGITLRTVRELEDQLVDLRAYAYAIRRAFEDSELARTYVTQPTTGKGGAGDALAVAMRWAKGHGPRMLMLVGEAGSGKTSLLRRLSYELVMQRDGDPSLPVPLLIDLGRAGPNATFVTMMQEHLHAAIGWRGNPEAILYLLHTGRVVLLFDDLEDSTAAPRGIQRVLRRLARSTTASGPATANRMAVTTRSYLGSATGEMFNDTSVPQNAQIAELAPFDRSQIATFLQYKLGAIRAKAALDRIVAAPALSTLASRPQLLQLLADVIVEADDTLEQATTSSLYDRYVARWINAASHGLLQPGQRMQVLEHLAAELWELTSDELSGEVLPRDTSLTADELDAELWSAPFLVRSTERSYRFLNRGFFDYFLARYLAKYARSGAKTLRDVLATEQLTRSCAALVAELIAGEPASLEAIEAVAEGDHLRYASENAVRIREALRARSKA
jgi:hypothetical protein